MKTQKKTPFKKIGDMDIRKIEIIMLKILQGKSLIHQAAKKPKK